MISTDQGPDDTRKQLVRLRAAVQEQPNSLKAETWYVAEDATSTFFYRRVWRDAELVLVRTIWNGGAQNIATVTDFFRARSVSLRRIPRL